jgi:hypothetical protein
MTRKPKRRLVLVPLFGDSVQQRRAAVEREGFDPNSAEGLLIDGLEVSDTGWEAVVAFEGDLPTGVEIRSTNGARITRAVWDRVRLAEVIADAVAQARWHRPTRAPAADAPKSPGRPRDHSDAHYRRVGKIYRDALATGSGKPVRAVASALVGEFPGLTSQGDNRARAWVQKARALGFIE